MGDTEGLTITPEARNPEPSSTKRESTALNWCFTLNNYTESDLVTIRQIGGSTPVKWLIFGFEVGSEGTPHLQGALALKKKQRLSGVSKLIPRAHIEKMKGTPTQNRDYCIKDGRFEEFGIKPLSSGEATKQTFKTVWELAKQGKMDAIADLNPQIAISHYNTINRIARDYQAQLASLDALDNWWFVGPPGSGKSRAARTENPVFYPKACNKWFCGYRNEEVIILDDFELDYKCLGHYLKIWGDHYPFTAENKGSSTVIRPKKIIITSNYTIEQVFCYDEEMIAAIKRRYRVRQF